MLLLGGISRPLRIESTGGGLLLYCRGYGCVGQFHEGRRFNDS